MSRWWGIAGLVLTLTMGAAAIFYVASDQVEQVAEKLRPAQDRAAFDRWLGQSSENDRSFAEFDAFLVSRGVADIVPTWQLTRSDSSIAALCAGGAFVVPPRELWANAVPVLGFVRDRVVPRVGPVEAISAWRSPRANRCSNGAKGSKHLSFSGIDFVTRKHGDPRELFTKLCQTQRELGPLSRFGLGAYFDPAKPERNREGRFHVDLAGFRSWGFGYGGEGSGCRKL
jgi:hypothetical protein